MPKMALARMIILLKPSTGYTHHQQAMPYTFGSFLMSHFYSLIDDLEILQFAYSLIDKNPLVHDHLGDGDYINCPMTEAEYDRFWRALREAERAPLHNFEEQDARFFEGCLPVEVIAGRGLEALAYRLRNNKP